ncbi:N-succinylarginine dihydrolase [Brevundimonas sp. 2R-24]|uniref:N-succinylarginine dihydrolase n=1 Tax=Peiella sedimenti TaxID=3061083 RepID=A0ABT8SIZ2_9CAUL|nr:N-succinylarginine dihydrolase [Caulobacteraceae bacterium XZ-24]
MTLAHEANCDGLVGPTHSYAGLSPGNLASDRNRGQVSDPRGAALEGLAKMKRLADLGIPQFVLPPHQRPHIPFLRDLGFSGKDGEVLASAWKEAPAFAAAACSASAMWAANAATVTPSADALDGRLHLSAANLTSNIHRALEGEQTHRILKRLFPDEARFAVHGPLPSVAHLGDEGAANHVRLCAEHGQPGVNLFVWGRDGWERWQDDFPARQTLQASEAVARRHGTQRPVFARQGRAAIGGGAFHNDVVCVGTREALLFHELAFEDKKATLDAIRRAAEGLFEPVFLEILEADLPIEDAVSSYLFNSQLLTVPGQDRLTLLAPVETRENPRAHAAAEKLAASNGPIGAVEYVDVRQSMRNGGGPACLRLRVVMTEGELAAANPAQRLTEEMHARLSVWVMRWYRDRMTPADLADPLLIDECYGALDELTAMLHLGSGFYPFQRHGA